MESTDRRLERGVGAGSLLPAGAIGSPTRRRVRQHADQDVIGHLRTLRAWAPTESARERVKLLRAALAQGSDRVGYLASIRANLAAIEAIAASDRPRDQS